MQFADIFRFEKFVAPVLVKVVYWIGLILIVLLTLVSIAGMSLFSSYYSGYYGGGGFHFGGALAALVFGAFGILLWRVVCELWVVTFSINERLGALVELKKAEKRQ